MSSIQLLRNNLCEQRRRLNAEFQQQAAQSVCNHFFSLLSAPTFGPGNSSNLRVALYFAVNGELDPAPIMEKLWQTNHAVYLPILHNNDHGYMEFCQFNKENNKKDPLQKNRFGILEPVKTKSKLIDPKQLDVVLMPLVAFDNQGNRVGMGAGYYDRSFNFLLNESRPQKPLLIGLGYDLQRVELLKPNSWDVPLNVVITESGANVF